LVHQPKETQLAQQLSIGHLSEVQAQEVERFSFYLIRKDIAIFVNV